MKMYNPIELLIKSAKCVVKWFDIIKVITDTIGYRLSSRVMCMDDL